MKLDFHKAAEAAIQLAKMGAIVFPTLGAGAALAQGALDIVDGLHAEAPDDATKAELDAAHRELYDAMSAKGHTLSSRLRG